MRADILKKSHHLAHMFSVRIWPQLILCSHLPQAPASAYTIYTTNVILSICSPPTVTSHHGYSRNYRTYFRLLCHLTFKLSLHLPIEISENTIE